MSLLKHCMLGIAGVALVLLAATVLGMLLQLVGPIGQGILLAVFVGCAVGVNFWAYGETRK